MIKPIPDMKQQTSRMVWLDVLRMLAILMVVCIHSADPFNVTPEARSNPEFNYWGSIYGSLLRPCVPLFVMITGVLLLPIKMPMGAFYKKRLLRIAIPFLVWSILYNLFPWVTGVLGFSPQLISEVFAYAPADASQSLGDALRGVAMIPFQFNVYTTHMWYLYMLIGLYLYMPFFSAWVERASVKQQKLFLGLWAVTLCLPYAFNFFVPELFGTCAWNPFGTFYYFAGFNGYLLLGHFLTKEVKEWPWGKTLMVCLPLFAVGFVVTYLGFKAITAQPEATEQEVELFFLYCSPHVAMMTVALFLLVRKVRLHHPRWIALMANITKCGLGIYLAHYFVVGFGYALAERLVVPVSLRIPVTAVIAFAVCWSFVAVCHRLSPRWAKRLLG